MVTRKLAEIYPTIQLISKMQGKTRLGQPQSTDASLCLQKSVVLVINTGRLAFCFFLKKCFICVGEKVEYGFDQQG